MTAGDGATTQVTKDALVAAVEAGRPIPPGHVTGEELSSVLQELLAGDRRQRWVSNADIVLRISDTLVEGDVRLLRRPRKEPYAEREARPALLLGGPPVEEAGSPDTVDVEESTDDPPRVVEGDLVLTVGGRPVVLELDRCVVAGTVEIVGVWARRLAITNSRLRGRLLVRRAHVDGDLDLTGTTRPFIDTATSTIEGRVLEGLEGAADGDVGGEPMPVAPRDAESPKPTSIDAGEDRGDKPFPWDTVTQVVGLAAALAAWIAVIGGARFWARADNMEVPPIPLLAGAGQEWLLTEGLQSLTLPVVLAAVVALGVYFAIPDEPTRDETTRLRGALVRKLRQSPDLWLVVTVVLVALTVAAAWQALVDLEGWWKVASVILAAVVGTTIAAAMSRRLQGRIPFMVSLAGLWLGFTLSLGAWAVTIGWLTVMAIFTAVVVLVAALALTQSGRRGTALTIFAAIVIWSGALSFFYEAGARDPEETYARVTLTDATVVDGRLVARSGSRLYLAGDSPATSGGGGPVVEVFDNDNIAALELAETDVWPGRPGDEPSGDSGFSGGSPSGGDGGEDGGAGEEDGGAGGEDGGGGGGSVSEPVPVDPDGRGVAMAAELGGSPLHVEARRLTVRDRFVALDLAVFNPSDAPVTIGNQLSDDEEPELSSIRLVDTRNRWAYPVARHDDGSCVCSGGLDRPLEPQQWRNLTALFMRPDPLPAAVDLRIRGVPWMRSVPVD
ncbi:MFS transporter [Nocardioides caldifontis]|uniref:MFS transporter n=1 Tax=Nocardioides caldifontis TaxID=2588938 RepID=UPI0013968327|nr:MFS transporter [Nocardioides caldifontis]